MNNCIAVGWQKRHENMKDINMANAFSCSVIKTNLSGGDFVGTERYIEQIEYLLKYVPSVNGMKILEIGSAYGGLLQAMLIKNIIPNCYTMVDSEPMLRLAKENIGSRFEVVYILPENVETIVGKYDLMISNFCLNETPIEYQNYVTDNVAPNCRIFFGMIDKPKGEEYGRLKSKFSVVVEEDGPYNKALKRKTKCLFMKNTKYD